MKIYNESRLKEMMDTRNGFFLNPDGTMNDAFFDLADKYQKQVEYAKLHTVLPERCDMKKIEELYRFLNSKAIRKDYKILEF